MEMTDIHSSAGIALGVSWFHSTLLITLGRVSLLFFLFIFFASFRKNVLDSRNNQFKFIASVWL